MAATVIAGLVLAVPAGADAARFLSRSHATSITRQLARDSVSAPVTALRAFCYPSFRRHTRRNLGRQWRLWDCTWRIVYRASDGSMVGCETKVRITGQRHGWTYRRLHPARCRTLVAPAPAPSPTPAPTPTATPLPSPSPQPGLTARQRQMIDAARTFGVQRAQELVDHGQFGGSGFTGSFYYGQIQVEQCVFLNASLLRCPVYLWWDSFNQDASFRLYESREIEQASVFVEDLGTSVGFDERMEPDGALDYDFNRPYYLICSDWFDVVPPRTCTTSSAFPVQYPPSGYPRPVGP
jgi:hypothetical protein